MPGLLELAVEEHKAGRLAKAESLYRRIVAAEPRNADALRLLGLLAQQQGRLEDATRWLEQAAPVRAARGLSPQRFNKPFSRSLSLSSASFLTSSRRSASFSFALSETMPPRSTL
jgi:tetratricopeptide (TPR) repeat protein